MKKLLIIIFLLLVTTSYAQNDNAIFRFVSIDKGKKVFLGDKIQSVSKYVYEKRGYYFLKKGTFFDSKQIYFEVSQNNEIIGMHFDATDDKSFQSAVDSYMETLGKPEELTDYYARWLDDKTSFEIWVSESKGIRGAHYLLADLLSTVDTRKYNTNDEILGDLFEEISSHNYDEAINSAENVTVLFYDSHGLNSPNGWLCRILKEAAPKFTDDVKFYKFEDDSDPSLSANGHKKFMKKYDLKRVPYMHLFNNGEYVSSVGGGPKRSSLHNSWVHWIEGYFIEKFELE